MKADEGWQRLYKVNAALVFLMWAYLYANDPNWMNSQFPEMLTFDSKEYDELIFAWWLISPICLPIAWRAARWINAGFRHGV